MSADPALTEEEDQHLREMTQHVRALDAFAPAELARLYASPALQEYARRVVRAVAALQHSFAPHETAALQPDIGAGRLVAEGKYSGPAPRVDVRVPAGSPHAV